jgi:tetratricopeptide (TPR) repeat protein
MQGQSIISTSKPKTRQEAENQTAQMEQFLNLPIAYSTLASFYEEKNELTKASENIEKAFVIKTSGRVTFYDVRARIRFKQGDYKGAVSDWNNALVSMPPFAHLYLERSSALYMSGKEAEEKRISTNIYKCFRKEKKNSTKDWKNCEL